MIQSGDSFIAQDDIAVVIDILPMLKSKEVMYVVLKNREKSLVHLDYIVDNIVPPISPRCNIMYQESEGDKEQDVHMIDVRSIDEYTPTADGFNIALSKEQFKNPDIHKELKLMLHNMALCPDQRISSDNYITFQRDNSPRFTCTLPGYNQLEWTTMAANLFPATTSDGNLIENVIGILRAMRVAKKSVLNERDAETWAKKFFLTLTNISQLYCAQHDISKFETVLGYKFPIWDIGTIKEQYIEVSIAKNVVSVDPQLNSMLSAICVNWRKYLPQHTFSLDALKDKTSAANTINQRLAVTPMATNFDLGINIHQHVMVEAMRKMCEQFLAEGFKRTYVLPSDLAGFVETINDAKTYLRANFSHYSKEDCDFFLFDPKGFCNNKIVREMGKYIHLVQMEGAEKRKGFNTLDKINFLSFDTLERECLPLQQLGPVLFITDRSMSKQMAVSINYDLSKHI